MGTKAQPKFMRCFDCISASPEGQNSLAQANEEKRFQQQVTALLELLKWEPSRSKIVTTVLQATKGDAKQAMDMLKEMDK